MKAAIKTDSTYQVEPTPILGRAVQHTNTAKRSAHC